jgi:hypothetical protein
MSGCARVYCVHLFVEIFFWKCWLNNLKRKTAFIRKIASYIVNVGGLRRYAMNAKYIKQLFFYFFCELPVRLKICVSYFQGA